jgi:hypothetical protein
MPLNLSVGDADFTPFLKYNAKAGRFYARADGVDGEIEIVNPVLAFDMANIRTGWLFYAEGSGPEKIWDPSPTQVAPKPKDPRKFKRGFEVMVYGNGIIPRTTQKLGLRELSSTAGNVITAMLRMYADYEAAVAANPGAVPIFVCEGVKPINGAYGVNYEPLFTLKGWVPRSRVPAFDEHAAAPPKAAAVHHDERNPPPATDGFGLDTVRTATGETEIPF